MDFLKNRTEDAIKRELASILDSYHHYWDPLAELLQNARDAVDRAGREGRDGPFFIRITIDAASRKIEVLDNGVGIPEDKISEVLSPGGGDKTNRNEEVGEKGVGLTYSIFCGGKFEVESSTEGGSHYGGKVARAREWLDTDNGDIENPKYESLKENQLKLKDRTIILSGTEYPLDSFTRISIAAIPPSEDPQDLFSLSTQQLKFLIRTRTAIGVTDNLFNDEFHADFNVYYDINMGAGETHSAGEIEVGYPRVHEYVDKIKKLDDVTSTFVTKTTDKGRRKFLKDTAVWATEEAVQNGEKIRVYGVMMPGNSVFANLSAGSLKIEKEGDDSEDSLFRSGIYLGTKKMPTGVEIPHGAGGKYPAYYRRCFFMVESDTIKFDLGRKSMHWSPKRRLQNAVSALFIKFEALAPYQSDERAPASQTATPSETKAERDARIRQEWDEYKRLVDLNLPQITFQKIPAGQEAAVAAIFHELLGARLLNHYRPLSTGYGAQYDLHALYSNSESKQELELVIEFKYALQSLVKDFENGRKNLDDVHLLVAWNADSQKLKDAGFHLDISDDAPYDGVTHEISLPIPGIDPIPVILLEKLIDTLRIS